MSEIAKVATLVPAAKQVQAFDIFDPATFEHSQRIAKVFAASRLVPQHMQNNVADCLIALQIARRLNEEPLTVMQQIYIVNGRPGWYTTYMISRVNRSGVFKGPITWSTEGQGDALTVTAKAILADSGEIVDATCDMRMAKAEGWTKNAKYTSMPAHMLRWRSAAMLIRLYAPEVMLGMPVVEELETLPSAGMRDVTPQKTVAQALDDFANDAAQQAEETDAQQTGGDGGAGTQAASGEASGEPADGDGTSAEGKPHGQQEAQTAAATEISPTAAKETASVSAANTVEAARERGAADFRRGVQRKACPPEYREKPELSAAWVDGWAKARAEAGL